VKGRVYRFKYDVENLIGWSGESQITYITAANVPSKPLAPQLGSVSSTDIDFVLTAP
jgi:hypothetical protein